MASQAELQLILSALDRASAQIKRVAGGLDTLGTSTKQLADKQTHLQSQLSKSEAAIGKLGSKLKTLAVGFGIAAGAALSFALKDAISAASEHQRILAQTEAVIKSTGGTAGFTATQFEKMAVGLSRVIPISHDVIIQTENMLTEFRNVRGDEFKRATEAALNLSIAIGIDAPSAAKQLGIALEDPIGGMLRLRRSGVLLSATQKTQVENFIRLGDVAAAQRVILGQLEVQFGGAGRAAGQTFSGQMEIARNSIKLAEEALGGALIPALTKAATAIGKLFSEHQEDIKRWADNIVAAATKLDADFLPVLAKTKDDTVAFVDYILTHKAALIAAILAVGAAMLLAFPELAIATAVVGIIGSIELLRTNIKGMGTSALTARRGLDEFFLHIANGFIEIETLGTTHLPVVGKLIRQLAEDNSQAGRAAQHFTDDIAAVNAELANTQAADALTGAIARLAEQFGLASDQAAQLLVFSANLLKLEQVRAAQKAGGALAAQAVAFTVPSNAEILQKIATEVGILKGPAPGGGSVPGQEVITEPGALKAAKEIDILADGIITLTEAIDNGISIEQAALLELGKQAEEFANRLFRVSVETQKLKLQNEPGSIRAHALLQLAEAEVEAGKKALQLSTDLAALYITLADGSSSLRDGAALIAQSEVDFAKSQVDLRGQLIALQVLMGQAGLTSKANTFRLAISQLGEKFREVGETGTEAMHRLGTAVFNFAQTKFDALFNRPTRETAEVQLKIAELQRLKLLAQQGGATDDALKVFDDQITALQRNVDLKDAENKILQLQATLADKTILTDQEQVSQAFLLIGVISQQSALVQELNDRLAFEIFAQVGATNALNDFAAALQAAHAVIQGGGAGGGGAGGSVQVNVHVDAAPRAQDVLRTVNRETEKALRRAGVGGMRAMSGALRP